MMLKRNNFTWFIILIIPFIAYLYTFFKYAQNIPFEDDFAVMRSWWNIINNTTPKGNFHEFISPSNEHPIIISKLFFGLQLLIFGKQNFVWLILIGNLIFLSSFVALYKIVTEQGYSKWYFLPIPYILLSLYFYESSLWAICTYQYNDIFALFIWGLYFALKSNKTIHTAFALLFLALTAVTNGNGILGFLLVGFIWGLQKKWRQLFILVIILVTTKLLLLNNSYHRTPNDLIVIIKSLLILTGGTIKIYGSSKFNMLLGAASIGVFILFGLRFLLSFKQNLKDKYQVQLIAIGLFCLGTILGLSIFRGTESSAFPDRYRLYPQFFTVIIYLLILPISKDKLAFSKIFMPVILLISIAYWAVTFKLENQSLISHYNQVRFGYINYTNSASTLQGQYYRGYFDETARFYESKKYYQYQNHSSVEKFAQELLQNNYNQGGTIKLNIKQDDNFTINIEENTLEVKENQNSMLLLKLENSEGIKYFIPVKSKSAGFFETIFNPEVLHKGFNASIFKYQLPYTSYKLSILKLNNLGITVYNTNITINSAETNLKFKQTL